MNWGDFNSGIDALWSAVLAFIVTFVLGAIAGALITYMVMFAAPYIENGTWVFALIPCVIGLLIGLGWGWWKWHW